MPESIPTNGHAAQISLFLEPHYLNHLPARNLVVEVIIPGIILILVHYCHPDYRRDTVISAFTNVGIFRENSVLPRGTLVSVTK